MLHQTISATISTISWAININHVRFAIEIKWIAKNHTEMTWFLPFLYIFKQGFLNWDPNFRSTAFFPYKTWASFDYWWHWEHLPDYQFFFKGQIFYCPQMSQWHGIGTIVVSNAFARWHQIAEMYVTSNRSQSEKKFWEKKRKSRKIGGEAPSFSSSFVYFFWDSKSNWKEAFQYADKEVQPWHTTLQKTQHCKIRWPKGK